ncbi:gliding motility-associated C-terminal domain-containing protein [Aurantibacter sp.]|uniref:gliding motility-associated C-terminal domain-containing protein n=1 Tax=Aurantibacter sp. TaxID=2807103 RepID=UPI003262D197
MVLTTTLKIRITLLIANLFFGICSVCAQTKDFATTIINEEQVNASANSIDTNLNTNAEIMASSGIALGIGAYSGELELGFTQTISANKTSYVKIETEDDLLPSLLGGSLGGLLANITGTLLIGNQEFSVEAKNGSTTVLSRASNSTIGFSNDDLRIVSDQNDDYFLAISPSLDYDRIKITNRIGSLIGLNNTKALNVFGAYTSSGSSSCGTPNYTSFSGNGITLDLLNIGGAGVTNPGAAIDQNPSTFSELSLGILGVAASIEQTIYFDTPSHEDDSFYLQLSTDPSLLQAGVLNNIEVVGQNGTNNVVFTDNLSSLINLDVLTLLQDDSMATIEIHPDANVDRLTIRLSSLLNVALEQQLQIHEVFVGPSSPVINGGAENVSTCYNTAATIIATADGDTNTEIRWYDAPENGNLLATVNSGETFTTPTLTTDTTFYVASAKTTCSQESARIPVIVNVVDIPTAGDIEVSGNQSPVCSSSEATLIPTSDIDGTFSWYFDPNGTNEITDGLVSNGATYTIDSNGTLRINNLDDINSPYTYYVKITEASASCENAPGDYKEVIVTVVDSDFDAAILVDTILDIDDLVNIYGGDTSLSLTGNVIGDVNAGDLLSLTLNNITSGGAIDANLDFNIDIDANDLIDAVNTGIETTITNGVCTVTGLLPIDLPELPTDNLTQIFCETELAVVSDLQVSRDDIVFFENLTSDVLIDANTPLVDGEVYVAGLIDIPTSVISRIEITVDILSVPTPTTDSANQTFCASLSPVVGDIQVNEQDVIFYDSMSGGNELNPSTALVDGETYYVAQTQNGCESTSRLVITVAISDDEPILMSGQFEDVCLNRDYTYAALSGKENYIWTITGGTITEGGTLTDESVSVRWTDLQDTSIHLSYTDSTNCNSDSGVSQSIATVSCGEVLGEEFSLIVYNEFTPNNDGYNDFFKVDGLEVYDNTVEIYNRNGSMVFSAVNYQNTWDGIANVNGILRSGEHLPAGTYFYKINIPEIDRDLVGWLQLAR